jgi:hypothetical protein
MLKNNFLLTIVEIVLTIANFLARSLNKQANAIASTRPTNPRNINPRFLRMLLDVNPVDEYLSFFVAVVLVESVSNLAANEQKKSMIFLVGMTSKLTTLIKNEKKY